MSTIQTPPSIGSIVRYVPKLNSPETHNNAEILPAIVTRSGDDNSEVNLRIFTDGPLTTWHKNVPYSPDKEQGTWHWPEVAKAFDNLVKEATALKDAIKENWQSENLSNLKQSPVIEKVKEEEVAVIPAPPSNLQSGNELKEGSGQ